MLQHRTKLRPFLVWIGLLILSTGLVRAADAGFVNVREEGATGDGVTDDTAAFQSALDKAAAEGGGIVTAPTGDYRIAGHLTIPASVTLNGIWQGPNRFTEGSLLLAYEGQGNAGGTPFITMMEGSGLTNLAITYPNQTKTNPPLAFPWTVRGNGSHIRMENVFILNPYQALDFGTNPCDYHNIKAVYGQALHRGIFIDQSKGGRIEDLHWWAFWDLDLASAIWQYTFNNAVAYEFGAVKDQTGINCFCINYATGSLFRETPYGVPSAQLNNWYMDGSPIAIIVEKCDPVGGIKINGGIMFDEVVVEAGNQGPLTITGCTFLSGSGIPGAVLNTDVQARLAGSGTITFAGNYFAWDQQRTGAPCIDANCASVVLTGNEFRQNKALAIRLGPNVESAVIANNRAEATTFIQDNTGAGTDLQIGLIAD